MYLEMLQANSFRQPNSLNDINGRIQFPVDISGSVMGESPDCLLLFGTVVKVRTVYCYLGLWSVKIRTRSAGLQSSGCSRVHNWHKSAGPIGWVGCRSLRYLMELISRTFTTFYCCKTCLM